MVRKLLAATASAVLTYCLGIAYAQVDMDIDHGIGWSPDFETPDFGFGKGETSSNPGGVCPGVDAVDPLSRRAQSILKSWSSCPLYSAVAYDRFLAEVPRDRHYAINYIAFVEGKPTLTSEQAEWWEREKSNLAYKPIRPGPDGIAPGRSNGAPSFATARPPLSQATQPASSVTAEANGPRVGACGFPITQEPQRRGQELLARLNKCDTYTGPRDDSAAQSEADVARVDAEEVGACGLPVSNPQGREAQETLARDGACEIAKSYLR